MDNSLREEITSRRGFTINVGVGSNKLLAKMASDFEKPYKVYSERRDLVQKVADMWRCHIFCSSP